MPNTRPTLSGLQACISVESRRVKAVELGEEVIVHENITNTEEFDLGSGRRYREQLSLMQDLEVARGEGAQWRTDMRELLKGLSSAIDGQFERWQLTSAEREIALLMLKGLSHREISIARDTSERTIRQQAQSIYGKANLSGRAALSAFFLEDLLLPRERG